MLRPGGLIAIAHFDWIALPGNVVEAAERLIVKHNPKWALGGGLGVYPLWPRDLATAGFADIETFSFDVMAPYTHEGWRGRIRASAGVGGTLNPEQVAAFDDEFAALLREKFPADPMGVHHRAFPWWAARAHSKRLCTLPAASICEYTRQHGEQLHAGSLQNISCTKIVFVYRQVGCNTALGIPRDEPGAGDVWYTEWLMIEQPEQSKYTANLLIFHKDNELPQDSYVFVPALRRSLRLAVSARCAPVAGSDFVQDDYNTKGFNGGLALFNAKYLGTRKILALANDYKNVTGNFPDNWDMPLGLSEPDWGPYELRTTDIIDVRRVPSEAAGYCYGSRIMYVDQAYTYATGSKSTTATCSSGSCSAAAPRMSSMFRRSAAW